MVACKILHEGRLLSGSQSIFDEIKAMLVSRRLTTRLTEMEVQAKKFRQKSEEYLSNNDLAKISRDDLNLFYTTEESEEFE